MISIPFLREQANPIFFLCFDNKDWKKTSKKVILFFHEKSPFKKVHFSEVFSHLWIIYPYMSSIADYLGLRKTSNMDNSKDEVRFPRELMNKLIMNYLVTGNHHHQFYKSFLSFKESVIINNLFSL